VQLGNGKLVDVALWNKITSRNVRCRADRTTHRHGPAHHPFAPSLTSPVPLYCG
jgi:hypothetical protein